MGENRYFQKALSDFTYESASGGAIRHLADSGYTVRQIVEQLDFPTPYERVQKAVWEHLVKQGTILLEPPGEGGQREKVTYVREYDQYGKAYFRRVVVQEEAEAVADWTVQVWDASEKLQKNGGSASELLPFIRAKREENGINNAYVSLDFGLVQRENLKEYEAMLSALDVHQREYVSGLPWEGQRVYHKLDSHGLDILLQLYGAGQYQGECYFLKSKEVVRVISE